MQGSETILICDDEAALRNLVRKMLVRQGYRVLDAETPEQALQVAREHGDQIDLLLTDIVMPGMQGFELAKAVKDLAPQTKVLYMSGFPDTQSIRSSAMGFEAPFLKKPFTAMDLWRKLREILEDSPGKA